MFGYTQPQNGSGHNVSMPGIDVVSWHSEYHRNPKPAINVKHYFSYNSIRHLIDEYGETEYELAYEDCKEAFWEHYAQEVSERFGYGKVYSEGRSGGWLVVENPPMFEGEKSNLEYNDDDTLKEELKKWLDFQIEILSEMDYCCNQRLTEILEESRRVKLNENAEREYNESRDIITV